MSENNQRVCPVEIAGSLDNKFRKWLQNPHKILGPYVKDGMTVLDIGCGPGVYAVEMARLVGTDGHVFACDLQEGMLEKLKEKIEGSDLAERITLCKSEEGDIGATEPVDFVLAFYIVHEVVDQDRFFKQIAAITRQGGQLLIVEPPLHVSRVDFKNTIEKARIAGFEQVDKPKVFLSKTILMTKHRD